MPAQPGADAYWINGPCFEMSAGQQAVTGTWAAAGTATLDLTELPASASGPRAFREVNVDGHRAYRASHGPADRGPLHHRLRRLI